MVSAVSALLEFTFLAGIINEPTRIPKILSGSNHHKLRKEVQMATSNSTQLPQNVKDEAGKVYGKLTVIEFVGIRGNAARWHCCCECGRHTNVRGAMLRSGNARSCGCTRYLARGLYGTSEHRTWSGMKTRCYNPQAHSYRRHGARGITICDRWRKSFVNFLADMGPKPFPEASIERVDNDGPYSPENCVWASRLEQARNMRSNRLLTYNGETMCLSAWAQRFGLQSDTIAARIARGWSIEKALTTPVIK